eukprot:CAMPEP_0175801906 /NCGR_PEP_ID=MMETSP0097-20121207/87772_1 /TAXON_ID=311494 /ORGANISM="Alexandrium monilatum, Strain CCMP3105" /LENGTH=373 /DNA_ID=CAMNT_0017113237 /DNA_START=185 /DNA_END=1306 /DNA_ORIENTATION=+
MCPSACDSNRPRLSLPALAASESSSSMERTVARKGHQLLDENCFRRPLAATLKKLAKLARQDAGEDVVGDLAECTGHAGEAIGEDHVHGSPLRHNFLLALGHVKVGVDDLHRDAGEVCRGDPAQDAWRRRPELGAPTHRAVWHRQPELEAAARGAAIHRGAGDVLHCGARAAPHHLVRRIVHHRLETADAAASPDIRGAITTDDASAGLVVHGRLALVEETAGIGDWGLAWQVHRHLNKLLGDVGHPGLVEEISADSRQCPARHLLHDRHKLCDIADNAGVYGLPARRCPLGGARLPLRFNQDDQLLQDQCPWSRAAIVAGGAPLVVRTQSLGVATARCGDSPLAGLRLAPAEHEHALGILRAAGLLEEPTRE